MADLSAELTVVVHQIRSPDNLGAIARLMANFGIRKLALSNPATYAFAAAGKLAVGAESILDHLQLHRSLADAVGHAIFAVGSTSRHLRNRAVLDPEEGLRRLARNAERGPVALVLGGEKRGLSDEELRACQEVIRIPTSSAQPSMNVAQAAAVLLYLWRRHHRAATPREKTRAGAKLEMVQRLESLMGEVLLDAGFLNPQSPKRALGILIDSLFRRGLSEREAEMWVAAFRQLRRAVNLGSPGH